MLVRVGSSFYDYSLGQSEVNGSYYNYNFLVSDADRRRVDTRKLTLTADSSSQVSSLIAATVRAKGAWSGKSLPVRCVIRLIRGIKELAAREKGLSATIQKYSSLKTRSSFQFQAHMQTSWLHLLWFWLMQVNWWRDKNFVEVSGSTVLINSSKHLHMFVTKICWFLLFISWDCSRAHSTLHLDDGLLAWLDAFTRAACCCCFALPASAASRCIFAC